MKWIVSFLVMGALFFCGYFFVVINGSPIVIERVITSSALQKGLSGRSNIAPSRGMLFQFDKPGVYGFWMKDMNFPIDIVWMSGRTVIGVHANVPVPLQDMPNSGIPSYLPPNLVNRVLELRAGRAHELGITTGTIMYGF